MFKKIVDYIVTSRVGFFICGLCILTSLANFAVGNTLVGFLTASVAAADFILACELKDIGK